MASGRFSKQAAPYNPYNLNANANTGDTLVGGALTGAPNGYTGSGQFQQNLPGDRVIFSPADALAYSNNAVGNLYTGTYRYVGTRSTSTSSPALGHGAFWDVNAAANASANAAATTASDVLYQVTSDEPANNGINYFAGVFLSPLTKGNWGWIQESGKTSCKFLTTITGTPTQGKGVYLGAGNNNANAADVGCFDQLVGANSAAIFTANSTTGYTTVDNMISRYIGVAEALPSNNNVSIVDITMQRASFRW